MDEEEIPNENIINWTFCPICGTKIPKLENIKFCIKCGVDLQYIKTHRILPQNRQGTTEYKTLQDESLKYFPIKPKLNDDDLIDLKDKKLWSTTSSLGITLLAYILMNIIVIAVTILFIFLTFDLEGALDLLLSPYFLIFSSFIEFVLIIVPIMYVGKYLENPSLKNRLRILGFTVKGFKPLKVLKEIFIGLMFAVLGVILVFSVSFLMELLTYSIFGSEVLQNSLSESTDIDIIISSSDYLSLTLLILIMILVIGTSEEILFRGFLQKGLKRTLGKWWGLTLTALIFSLIHLIGTFLLAFSLELFLISFLLSFFPYFTISLLLGFIYDWRKENLIAVVITHGFYDAFTIILAFIFYTFS